jgi:polysaccharide export outer membrane protein
MSPELNQKIFRIFAHIVLPIASICFFSCSGSRKALYFVDIRDSILSSTNIPPEPPIQSNDLLAISVSSLSPEASSIFNTVSFSNSVGSPAVNLSQAEGYLVNAAGFIQFPVLGNIKVGGLTKEQVKQFILQELIARKLLIDPVISVRYLNFKVTVLGEVARPSVISVPSEKISILEAIGLAGDLTIYAKRDNILVIREENGKKNTKRLDLNSGEIFSSPYYYLRSNDVVYVEPGKAKIAGAGRGQFWIPIVLSGATLMTIVADRLIQ